MSRAVRLLLADDSPLFERWVQTELVAEGAIELVGVAANGRAACELSRALAPDLVLMDVHMPVMNGLEAVRAIMAERPVPIVVTTGDPSGRDGALAFEAIRRGALDVLPKPERWRLDDRERALWRSRLVSLATVRARRDATMPYRPSAAVRPSAEVHVVAIGASTGGPAALATILAHLPPGLGVPVLVVQHLAPGFARGLADWLDRVTPLPVRLAQDGERFTPGEVLVAPDGVHLTAVADRARLVPDASRGHVPSIDALFRSLARDLGGHAMGILLTGMGTDGVSGLADLRAAGSTTIAQDEASSVVWGMPGAAMARGAAMRTATPREIARIVASVAGGAR